MKICTTTGKLLKRGFSDEEVFKRLKDAGFDAADYSFFCVFNEERWNEKNYKDEAKRVREIAEKVGIPILQSHAPFSYNWKELENENDIIPEVYRAVEAAGIMGCEEIVVHPQHHPEPFGGKPYREDPEAIFQTNMEYYAHFKPLCEQYGIKVCTENMWNRHPLRKCIDHDVNSTPAEFIRYLDTLNADGKNHFGGCLDLGHTVLVGQDPVAMIREMGDRITTLHIHDNNYISDTHTMPGHGKIPMADIFKALKEIGYQGKFTLEADNFFANLETEFLPVALKYMNDLSRFYAAMME